MRIFLQKIKEWLFGVGVWRRRLSFYQVVALVMGSMIGAGILSIPYAISKVGVAVGLLYIFGIGLLTMGINLLVGEVAKGTTRNLQIVGLAGEYLGDKAKLVMSFLFYIQLFAILTIYIIGEGEIYHSFFGGSPVLWGITFWLVMAPIVYFGIHAVKKAEVVLTTIIILIIGVIAALSIPHINIEFYTHADLSAVFMPYGVILFSFSGVGTVPAAYQLLRGEAKQFKRAMVTSTLASMCVYALFTILVIGVTGSLTTEIATIGLGLAIGEAMFFVVNIFASLAMATSFLMLSMELKDSLNWDFSFSKWKASIVALIIPVLIYIGGLQDFVSMINIVGGILMSTQMILVVGIYLAAKKAGVIDLHPIQLTHSYIIAALAIAAFSFGAAYSVYSLLI